MNNNRKIRWYIDAAFAVHNDMKSHTRVAMTLGRGAGYTDSNKQNLNTRSSTEVELVGLDDEMLQVIWTRKFIQAQGYKVADNIIYQDSQSAIKLEMTGRALSGKRTRRISIRYFFVTDCIKAGETSMEYCPTLEMIGDFFTKPLQGAQFQRFSNKILGIEEVNILEYNARAKDAIAQQAKRAAGEEQKSLSNQFTKDG